MSAAKLAAYALILGLGVYVGLWLAELGPLTTPLWIWKGWFKL